MIVTGMEPARRMVVRNEVTGQWDQVMEGFIGHR